MFCLCEVNYSKLHLTMHFVENICLKLIQYYGILPDSICIKKLVDSKLQVLEHVHKTKMPSHAQCQLLYLYMSMHKLDSAYIWHIWSLHMTTLTVIQPLKTAIFVAF